MYKIIEFESGEVEVVPEFWIVNNEVSNTTKTIFFIFIYIHSAF